VVNYLVTHEGVKEETVYQMTKAVFDSLPDLAAAHAAARSIKLESALEGMPLPLHPGAARYFKEKGLKVGS
jgi:TRAP transporter TAXI family solute receptor